VAIVGPTASGKTQLALRLAQAVGGEIIGCDALQLRAGLPILTAKPTTEEQALVPHHLIGVLPMSQAASAAQYVQLADQVLATLAARGVPAIVCGGTGLYLRALRDGLFAGPPADPAVRAALRAEKEALGLPALWQRLLTLDPTAGQRIQPTDYVRIERALEIYLLSGRSQSDWFAEHARLRAQHGPRLRILHIGLDPGPALRERVHLRTQHMLATGVIDEVAAERARHAQAGTRLSDPPLGYPQVCQFLDGELTKQALHEALFHKTVQYAKRQRTWFRSEPDVSCWPTAEQVPLAEVVARFQPPPAAPVDLRV
jgi:tRNA dimethylallyltransferase